MVGKSIKKTHCVNLERYCCAALALVRCLFLFLLHPPYRLVYGLLLVALLCPLPLYAVDNPLDVDGSGVADSRDGLLILRRLNGASTIDTGLVLPDGASNAALVATIDQLGMDLDVDGSGVVNATDGVLVFRRLRGDAILNTGIVLPSGVTNGNVVATIDAFGEEVLVSMQAYYPLVAGQVRTYAEEGGVQPTVSIDPSTTTVNGRAAHVVRYAGGTLPDRQEYYTNDSDGLLFHYLSYVTSSGETREITFTDPWVIVPATVALGSTISQEGLAPARKTFPDGAWSQTGANFQATSTISGFETVTVAAGQFTAIKMVRSLSIQAAGQARTITSTFWYADEVGIIKDITTISGTTVTAELLSADN